MSILTRMLGAYKVTALYTKDYWLKTGGIATKDLKAPYAGEFTCATYDEAVAKVAELINEFKKAHDYCDDIKTCDDDAEIGLDDQNNIVFWNSERFFDDEAGDYVDFCVYFEDI